MNRQIAGPDNGTLFFDERPIEIGGFLLKAREAVPVPDTVPKIRGWQTAFAYASATNQASDYWIGDLVAYAESRKDWEDKLDQMMSVTGLSRQTIENRATISRKVKGRARVLAPSISHAAVVTKLAPAAQEAILEEAQTEGWTVSELSRAVTIKGRPAVLEGQAELVGQYRVIYADPAYQFSDSGVPKSGALGKASRHYGSLPIDKLCELPVKAHALENSVLFLWVPAAILFEVPPLVEAWGFEYKTGIVWSKVLGNWGHYVRVVHEHLLICTRGSCMPDVPTPMPDSVQVVRREGEHSEKPEHFRKLIEQLYTRGPYLELFARKRVSGWDTMGNDARLWSGKVEAVS
jgi:N6-adenosine-specific RNA methylase IME4